MYRRCVVYNSSFSRTGGGLVGGVTPYLRSSRNVVRNGTNGQDPVPSAGDSYQERTPPYSSRPGLRVLSRDSFTILMVT